MARGVSGTGSGFRVGWRAAGGGGLLSIFQFLLASLSFWRGAGRWATSPWGLDSFLIFTNFLGS